MAIISNMYNSNRMNLGIQIPLTTPLVIQLETSGYCNLECSFCPCGNPHSRGLMKQDIMTEDLFDTFVKQCLDFENPIKVLRIIGIGEPLINKNIAGFVKKAKDSGAFERVEITSNGVLLDKKLTNSLIENKLDTLLVSLEGLTNEKYYEVTKRNIDVAKLWSNLSYFFEKSRNTNTKLYIKTISASVDNQEEFLNKFGQICDYIYIEKIIENWPEFKSGATDNAIRYRNREYQNTKKVCIQPFKLLCVAANGDVMPCSVDWKRVNILGNIVDNHLRDIWEGEKLKQLRLSLLEQKQKPICQICKYTLQNQPDDIDDYISDIIARIKGN